MPSKLLDKLMRMANIASEWDLDESDLSKISKDVVLGYHIDKDSQAEWLSDVEKAIDLAKLKKTHTTFPWKDAANVKFPLIATAALQSGARMYPEIVRNGRVVEAEVIGLDPTGEKQLQAARVIKYMTYQLLAANADWETGTDKLLHILPVIGTVFRKTYFNPVLGTNEYEVCLPHEVIVHNQSKTLEKAPRVNHIFRLSYNEIVENVRAGIYTDYTPEELGCGEGSDMNFEEAYPEILEQHGFLDLDEDGYKEPYIITLHKDSGKILRIVARFNPRDISYNADDEVVRIEPTHYFTDYHFIPSPDGSFYSLGFGLLLLPLNETVNTLVNQLLNAGSLASLQGGILGGGLKLKGGELPIRPGEWRRSETVGLDISRNIVPINYKEPSPVLFQLLGFLIDHTDKLTSVTDALTGQEHTQNSPATSVTAMIEQGLKVFSSIMRRVHRSFQKEFAKIYRLNSLFVDPQQYMQVLGEQVPIMTDAYGNAVISDFDASTFNVIPISDPNVSSDTIRAAQNQLLLQLAKDPQVGTMLNLEEILRRVLQASNIPAMDRVILPPDQRKAPPPDPSMMKVQIEGTVEQSNMHVKEAELNMAQEKHVADMAQAQADLKDTQADATYKLAQAQSLVDDNKFRALELQIGILKENNKQVLAHIKGLHSQTTTAMKNESDQQISNAGDAGELASPPDNGGPVEVPTGQPDNSGAGPAG